jgi:hypothetical protein
MRRLVIITTTLFLAACATRPQEPAPQPAPVVTQRVQRSSIFGLTAGELVGHFGKPALQIREGPGLKLQFRSRFCVLDAYLYPPDTSSSVQRVTYVDARSPSGADADQAACISALENPR